MNKSKLDKDFKEIISAYKSGSSIGYLSEKYSCARDTVKKLLLKHNVRLRTPKEYAVKHSLNENYFLKIDNQNKAYILGFILADGSLISGEGKNRSHALSIEIKEEDSYILKKINEEMNHSRPLIYRSRNEKWSPTATLKIVSDKNYNNLINLGLSPNKSFNCKYPLLNNYESHLIRGIFDGDGTIFHRSCNNGQLQIICSPDVSLGINNFLTQNNISSYIINVPYYKAPLKRLTITKLSEIIKFKNLIYADANIFLKRKYDIFNLFEGGC